VHISYSIEDARIRNTSHYSKHVADLFQPVVINVTFSFDICHERHGLKMFGIVSLALLRIVARLCRTCVLVRSGQVALFNQLGDNFLPVNSHQVDAVQARRLLLEDTGTGIAWEKRVVSRASLK
jgi:hypothetical protein